MLDLEQIRALSPQPLRPFGRGLLREYLQYKVLEAIAELPVADRLRFMGGTCIHMVHGNPRFSEDLDFDNLDFDNLDITLEDFDTLCRDVRRALGLDGYRAECSVSAAGAFSANLRFPGLLHEQGLSNHPEEKLLIKIVTEPQRFGYPPTRSSSIGTTCCCGSTSFPSTSCWPRRSTARWRIGGPWEGTSSTSSI